MSTISKKTNTSILKTYSTIKRQSVNTVTFYLPSDTDIKKLLKHTIETNNSNLYKEFLCTVERVNLTEANYIEIISQSKDCIPLLKTQFSGFVKWILSLDWLSQNENIRKDFQSFVIDLVVAHNKHCNDVINQLILLWIPLETDEYDWPDGCPSEKFKIKIQSTFSILSQIVELIPMSFDIILEKIERFFPFYKRPCHIVSGYIHNIINFMDKRSEFQMELIQLVINKLIILDVNAPRHEIENEEMDNETSDTDDADETAAADKSDDNKTEKKVKMKHPIGYTLDVCLVKLMNYIWKKSNGKKTYEIERLFKSILSSFENVLLLAHNTHHVQFVIFYFCSLKTDYSDRLLKLLWHKVCDPNNVPAVRQSSIGYIASLLARAKFIHLSVLKSMLEEICKWAHQYIKRSDSMQCNSIKAHAVFYSVCQAIFYVIAFRSRHLTNDKKHILYLQNLHLSSIVTSHLNPLKVCLPTIVQAFAGITRAHQIAYCQTIIEKNSRRKLATVYLNNDNKNEQDECLETFFPFDPCLLKQTDVRICEIYYKYQAGHGGGGGSSGGGGASCSEDSIVMKRKRYESVNEMDDYDDFIIEKKQKIFENKYSYETTPGFQFQQK